MRFVLSLWQHLLVLMTMFPSTAAAATTLRPLMKFATLNQAYNQVFRPHKLSIGLIFPIENEFQGPIPAMKNAVQRVQLAEQLGYSAVWLRDVPFNVPSFGDAGQIYDPWVYLGLLTGQTSSIALGVASIVLPLRHPAHVAKAAASIDQLSQGRLLLGIASGDRPDEYPTMNLPYETREERFRDSYEYIRLMADEYPNLYQTAGNGNGNSNSNNNNHNGSTSPQSSTTIPTNSYGVPNGSMDMIPKPVANGGLPLLITGSSRQEPEWIAQHGNGWMTYPRPVHQQKKWIDFYRDNIRNHCSKNDDRNNNNNNNNGNDSFYFSKPVMQSLYIDLELDNPDAPPSPIHLGYRCGINFLIDHLRQLQDAGMNHVALNLRFNRANPETTLTMIAEKVLPEFHSTT